MEKKSLGIPIRSSGESCGNLNLPNKYKPINPKIAIQIAKKTSLSSICACQTKSALDKNLNANASSMNPKVTFTVFIHPPDFGNELIQLGKIANKTNGIANVTENPNEPTIRA